MIGFTGGRTMNIDWHGIYPAVTTQFRADGALDVDATQNVVNQLIDAGMHGLVMLGTIGENTSLSADEKRTVVRTALEAAAGRVPVVAGIAEYTTALAVQCARDCDDIGADALMALPAMVYNSDRRETIQHVSAVAGATERPIILYNNPAAYGVDIRPETLAALADVPNIVAVKESSADPRRITDIINLCGERLTLMAGVDDVVLECVLLGARGWVSGLANVFPRESVALFEHAERGELERARTIYRWLMPALHLDTETKLVQMIKLAGQVTGHGSEAVRAPRLPLEGAERERVIDIIETALANRPVM
jgi:4-hydroxy-tetrahydrodipicolinate synthase